MGGIVINNTGILDGQIYHHHSGDYQAGAGNHDDYRLFVSVETDERDPVLGGVRYFYKDNLVIMKEYPTNITETGADHALAKGEQLAASVNVYISTFDFLDLD